MCAVILLGACGKDPSDIKIGGHGELSAVPGAGEEEKTESEEEEPVNIEGWREASAGLKLTTRITERHLCEVVSTK